MIKIKNMLTDARHWLINFGHKNKEYLSILIAFLVLLISPTLLRGIDPSAAPIDPGVLSAIVLAIVSIMIFKSVTWWLIKSIWPVFAEYSTEHFTRNFKVLTPVQKCVIYLSFYCLLFCSFIVALVAFLP